MPQLTALLPTNRGEPKADAERERLNYAFGWFDDVCDQQQVGPAILAAQDDATLLAWLAEAAPPEARGEGIDVKWLRKDLAAYVRECNDAAHR